MKELALDRMSIEEVGLNPQRLAEAIHAQLEYQSGAVPVREIALALDIDEIREARLSNLEAALVTTPERGYGKILLNLNSSRQRRRFSLGHELLHFLNPRHERTSPEGFQCSRSDMQASSATQDRHIRQESEANAFAIELLTPRPQLREFLRAEPDLTKVLAIADEFDISREAAARRYVDLHGGCLAVVFSKDSRFTYAHWSTDFPFIALRRGQECRVARIPEGSISDIDEVDAGDWLARDRGAHLTAQTLGQAKGYATTLLRAALPDEDDDPGIDDTYERFDRWQGR